MEKDIQRTLHQLESDPGNEQAREKLELLCLSARRLDLLIQYYEKWTGIMDGAMALDTWNELAERLEASGEEIQEPEIRAEVLYVAGEVWNRKVNRQDRAMVLFQQAFRTWTGLTQALDSARDIYRQQDNYRMVVRLYDLQAQVTEDPREAAELHFLAGQTLLDHLSDREGAVEAFQHALELDPSQSRFSEAITYIQALEQNWQKLVQRFIEEATHATDPTLAASLYLRAATMLAEHDGSASDIEKLARLALQRDPASERAKELLRQVVKPETQARAVTPPTSPRPEPSKTKTPQPAARTVSTPPPPPTQAAQLPPQPVSSPPVSAPVLPSPAAPVGQAGPAQVLDASPEARLAGARTKEERGAVLCSLAQEALAGGDEAAAVSRLESALLETSGDPKIVDEVARILSEAGQQERLGVLLEDALKKVKRGPQEEAFLRQVARVHWHVRQDLDSAEKLWRRVKLAAPRDEEMLEFYAQLHEKQEDYKRLISVLASLQAVQEAVADKVATGRRMARIAEEKLQNFEKAIDVWKGVARIAPEEQEVRAALKRLFRVTEKWNALLEYYKEEIAALPASAVEQKVAIHREMLAIYQDHLHLDVMVINTYNAILQIDPANQEALDALAVRYEKASRWNDLVAVLKRKSDIEQDRDVLIELLRRQANLYLERFNNQAQAVKPLEQILEMRADDRETLRTLKEIYRQRRSWKQLLSVLTREAETVTGTARAELLEEAASLAQDKLSLPDQAIELWRARLAMAEGELPAQAVTALDVLYSRGKLFEDLTGLLRLQLERMTGEAAARYPILCRLGRLLVTPVNRRDEAITVWREALTLAPKGDHEARLALEQLYKEAEGWDELEQLLAAPADQAHLANVLETVARSHAAVETRCSLWRRVIRIASGPLSDADQVLRAREALLELEPENLDVVRALAPVYRQRSNWARLSTMLEILLAHEQVPGSPLRRSLYEQLWQLHEVQIKDRATAFRWCGKAFQEFPCEAIEKELVRLAERTDAWESLVVIARDVAANLTDAVYQLALHLTLGEICMTRLGWIDDAIEYFSKALAADPVNRQALDALEKLYGQTKSWIQLLEVLHRRIPLAGGATEQIEIYFRIAQINEEFLNQPRDAVAAFQALLALDGANGEALAGLERLFGGLEAWPELASIVERQVILSTDLAIRVDRIFLLARLHEEHLEQLSRAVDLYAELLTLEAEHGGAVERLEALLERQVEPQRVAALLEPVYRSRGDWRKLAGVLDVLRFGAADAASRVGLLKEIARLAEDRLQETRRAFDRLLEAFRLTPEDRPLWDELDRLATLLLLGDLLSVAFSDAVDGAQGLVAADRLELALRVAELKERLGKQQDAADAYHRALELEPTATAALTALERLHAELSQWAALVEILERRVVLGTADAERCSVLFRICELQEQKLADPAAACQTYWRILEIDRQRLDAWFSIERLYTEARRYAELGDLLIRLIGVQGDSAEGIAARYRLGQVQQIHLNDPLAAVESYRQVLVRTRHDETIAALNLLLAQPPEGLVGRNDFIRTLTEILEQVYLAGGDEADLIRVLDQRLRVSHDAEEQVELFIRMAGLHEQLEAIAPAFTALARALAVAPFRDDVAGELHRLAQTHALWPHLITALEHALASGPDPDVQIRRLREAATISVQELNLIEQAEGFLRRILAIDPTDAAALDELERCLRTRGDHEAVVAVLQQKVELAVEPMRRIALLHQVGEVLDLSLERSADAILAYRSILELDDREPRALDALERILETGEQWQELIPVLLHRVDCVETVEQRKRLHARIANIYDLHLQQADEAIGAWRAILDLDPCDQLALAELDRLFGREQRWVDLLDILQRRVELSADPNERSVLQLRQGHLLAGRLNDAERAIECFREVLEGAPGNEGARRALEQLLEAPAHRSHAAEILEPFYITLEAWSPLRNSLEIRLLDRTEPESRLELLLRIADLSENRLGDRNAAFHALARGFQECHADLRPIDGLHRLAGLLERWTDLVTILQEGAADEADQLVVKDLRLRVARILHHEVRDLQAAQQAYRKVLEVDGEETEALDALESIFGILGAHVDLLEIYRTKVLIARDDDDRIRLLLLAARLQRDILEQPQGAIESLRQVLEIRQDHAEANQALTHLLTFESRWAELADHLIHRLGLTQEAAERVRLKHELGLVYKQRLEKPVEAIHCFREVLEEQPNHTASIDSLEDYLKHKVEVEAVADILEPLYRQQQIWPKVVEVISARRDATEDPIRRGELALQIAGIQETRLRDADAAFTILSQALTETPDQITLRVELERLADDVGGWFEVVELFEKLVVGVTDPEAALAMRRSLARACDERLNDYARARSHWELVFDQDENDAEAVESLERIFTRTEEWAALVDLYQKRADRSLDPKEKISILSKVCNLYEEVLDDPVQAIGVYRQILDVDPEHAAAVRGLDRLLNLLERWDELAELLMRQAELIADPDEQIMVRHRLAVLLHEHLGRIGDSIDTFRTILLDAPGHGATIRSMENLLAALTARTGEAAAHRQQLTDLLEPYYVEREDWPHLIGLLETRYNDADDVGPRVALLREMAEVQERRMRDPGRAFATLCQAMMLDFGKEEVAEELDRLAEELNAWDRLINVYIDGLEGVEDHTIAVAMLLKLASIFDQKLRHVANAVECYRRLLTLEEGHPQALDALERLYAGAGAHERLVEVLTEKATRTNDPMEKKELYYRICEIWDEILADRHQAILAYRTLLELDPEDLVAIEHLERLYRATGDWRNLVEIYRQKVTLAADQEEQIKCLFEIATLEDEQLHNPDAAVEASRQVLDLDPVNPRAFGLLQNLFQREQRWPDLLELLEQALSIAPHAVAMDAIQIQIGELQTDQLDAVEDAIETYRTILERTPRHEGAMGALEKLLSRPQHRDRAARVLEPQYETAGNWSALVRVLDVQREECPDGVGRVELYRRMAALHEQQLGDRRAAFEALGHAFREEPQDSEIIGDLDRLVRELGDLRAFTGLMTEVLGQTDDTTVQQDLSRRLARLYDLELEAGLEAVPHYRRLLEFDEIDVEALAALDRIYATRSMHNELLEILQRRVNIAQGEEGIELRFRLGQLYETVFEELSQAVDQYRQILWEQAGHAGARAAMDQISANQPEHRIAVQEVLEPIYWTEEAFAELVKLYERRLELAKTPTERAALHLQVGDLLEQQLGNELAAFGHYRAALAEEYGDGLALENMRRLVEGLGTWKELAESMAELIGRTDDPELKRDHTLQLAAIQREQLKDDRAAEANYLAVLEVEPENGDVLLALEAIYRQLAEVDRLVGILQRRVSVELDPSMKITMLREIASLSRDMLDDAATAEASYRQILELDEGDDEALRALEKLVEARGDREELVRVLERRVLHCMDNQELLNLHRQLGLLALELGRRDEAIERYRSCLDIDPTSEELLCTLQELYAQSEQWEMVKELLIQRMASAESDDGRVELLLALATLAEERFHSLDEAEGYVRQVLEIRPEEPTAKARLERLLEALERWWDLVELYREQAREVQASNTEAALQLLLKVTKLAREKLQDQALAKETLQEVIALAPEHPDALDGLVELYAADADWEKCLETLATQISRAKEPTRLADLLYRKGELLVEKLDQVDEALVVLREALEKQPSHRKTLALLKELYRRQGDWESYVSMVSFQEKVSESHDEQFALLKEMAEIYREKLNDVPSALLALEMANDLKPGNPEIMRPLVEAYFDAGDSEKARPLLETLITGLREQRKFKELPRLLHRLGLILEQLGRPEEAVAQFKAAHDLDATYLPNLFDLGRAYYQQADWNNALKVFQTMLLHQSELKTVEERVDVFYHLGMVRKALSDPRRAKDMFMRALALNNKHTPSLQAMAELGV